MQKSPPLEHVALTALAPEDRIDVICDQFERDRSGKGAVDLGSYLALCEPAQRPRLFVELLLVESEIAERNSQNLDWSGYVGTFPEYADQIETARFRHLSVAACRFKAPYLPAATTPKRIDHFLMLEKVGTGATASVWKAWDTRLRRAVAIKIPLFSFATEEALDRFLREGWAAARLGHPGIVPVHAVGREGDLAYIVSDYIVGRNLRDYLQDFRVTPKQGAKICLAVAEALEHAHRHGIVHRDLKPANILLDEAGNPHIADFGLAKWSHDEIATTLEGRVLGTPAYMSPEQARGQSAKVDCRTDVFALGVVLFEMLTGRRPFSGDYSQLILQLVNADPPSARSLDRAIPKDLDTICRRAMDRQIERRYPNAAAMAEDLRRYLQNRPILSRRLGAIGTVVRAVCRHPALTSTLAFACIASVAVAMVGKLSIEKRHLLGTQTAVLATRPPGARLTFVPLHENTGQPIAEQLIRAPGRSPVEQELKPGDYLVVAALDDGRFHEVRRRVPSAIHLPGIFRNNRWKKSSDGKIILPTIDIPEKDATKDMTFLSPDANEAAVAAFYMDTTEFTVEQYSRSLKNWSPQGTRWESIPGNYAMTLRFDEALNLAELNGKRLPSENEYERATRDLEVKNDVGRDESLAGIGPVGSAPWDRTTTDPPILGLATNVAEWTTSTSGDPTTALATPFAIATATDQFVVRGGSARLIRGETALQPADHDPSIRTNTGRNFMLPGLGFRCVRSSAAPFAEK